MKKVYQLLFTFVCMFWFTNSVLARTCSQEEETRLKEYAHNVVVSAGNYKKEVTYFYEPANQDITDEVMYGYISVYNLTDEMYAKIKGDTVDEAIFSKADEADGKVNLLTGTATSVKKYQIELYASCGSLLRTVEVSVARYNPFQSYSECQDIPEFYYCAESISIQNLSDTEFKLAVTKYKNGSIDASGNEMVQESQASVFRMVLVVVFCVVLVGASCGVYYYRKKQSERSAF